MNVAPRGEFDIVTPYIAANTRSCEQLLATFWPGGDVRDQFLVCGKGDRIQRPSVVGIVISSCIFDFFFFMDAYPCNKVSIPSDRYLGSSALLQQACPCAKLTFTVDFKY